MAGITRYKITKTTTAIQFVDVDTDNDDVNVFSTSDDHPVVIRSGVHVDVCPLYTSPSPRDRQEPRIPPSA